MPDITHDFPINAPPARVFAALSDPNLLDEWWTLDSSGVPAMGAQYELNFGPEHHWRAKVTRCTPGKVFELTLTESDKDWKGTTVSMDLTAAKDGTQVRFAHRGWPEANEHYRISSFCWAMYLRVLKRNLEFGERVPYEKRLEV
jgi:uncharacterized protein YndB with AHSA1/START domain